MEGRGQQGGLSALYMYKQGQPRIRCLETTSSLLCVCNIGSITEEREDEARKMDKVQCKRQLGFYHLGGGNYWRITVGGVTRPAFHFRKISVWRGISWGRTGGGRWEQETREEVVEALTKLAVGWLRGASGFNTRHIKQARGVASWLGASRRGPGQGRSIVAVLQHLTKSRTCSQFSVHYLGASPQRPGRSLLPVPLDSKETEAHRKEVICPMAYHW